MTCFLWFAMLLLSLIPYIILRRGLPHISFAGGSLRSADIFLRIFIALRYLYNHIYYYLYLSIMHTYSQIWLRIIDIRAKLGGVGNKLDSETYKRVKDLGIIKKKKM